jgi:hypothetical protein
MSLLEQVLLFETEKRSKKELEYTVSLINKTYNEWRKVGRRINAVDIITTTVNRIVKMDPASINFLNEEMKTKMAIIIMRCMDNPYWKPVENKAKLYEKLFPIMKPLENFKLNTGTDGTLKQIIMTRLSANLSMQHPTNKGKIMVCYEPSMPKTYSRYLLGDHTPDKIYKMQPMMLPGDFDTLVKILKIDLEKAEKKFGKAEKPTKSEK